MATYLTGPDPNAAVWPVPLKPVRPGSRPTGYAAVGGAEIAVIGDGSDATYITQQKADNYFRYNCASMALPNGARVSMVTPSVRAKMAATNVRNDWVVGLGDHSGVKYAAADYPYASHHAISSASIRNYSGPGITRLIKTGGLITQADLERGLYVEFGLNNVYGTSAANPTINVYEAKLQLAYDLAPTAVWTGVATGGTISDTASPLLTWDYYDDFQPMASYRITIKDAGSVQVYDSGLVSSSDTSHQVDTNLTNGTYTATLTVYQAWSGPGGAFPSLSSVTGTFTVGVLRLGTPRISSATSGEQTTVTVTPDVNLLNLDDSTFDRGVLSLTATAPVNCTVAATGSPVKDGTGSAKITITNVTNPTVSSKPLLLTVEPLDQYNALVYLNPLALTGRTATLKINFRNSAGAILSTVSSAVTTLVANTWTAVTVTNATAPLLSASLDYQIVFGGTAVSNAIYLDNVGIWHGGGPARQNLSTNPNFETGVVSYSATGNVAPSFSQIGTDAYVGTKCMKILSTGANVLFPGVSTGAFTTVVGAKYTVSAYFKLPTAGACSSANIVIPGIGLNGIGGSVTTKDAWTRATITFVATATSHSASFTFAGNDLASGQYFYVDAVLIEQTDSALSYFDGSYPGSSWSGTADGSTSTMSSAFPTWSRGGFFEDTPNILAFDDSTFEGDSHIWGNTVSVFGQSPATTVAASSDRAAHGSRSLKLTMGATANSYAQLGTTRRFACTPGETIYTYAQMYVTAASRQGGAILTFYTAADALITYSAATAGTANTWVAAATATVVPANAAYFILTVGVNATVGTIAAAELAYFDAISVYRASQALGFTPGFFPDSDDAPTIIVQYSEDEETWTELGQIVASPSRTAETFYDYSVRSGVPRLYRAYLTVTENSTFLTSDYSSTTTVELELNGVWMASDEDPAGTSHQWYYDGGGRSRVVGANPSTVDVEGRDYGFSEFGGDYTGAVSVSLQLASAEDQAHLEDMAKTKTEVVFRDGRGRAYRGTMGQVTLADTVWGQVGTFTLQLSGIQP